MLDECKHGLDPQWCGVCSGVDAAPSSASRSTYGFYGGETKQDLLAELCDLLGLPRASVGVGSSLPSGVFDAAALAAGVPQGSMPEIGEAIALKAGMKWGCDCDSRGSISGGGSTVTAEGLRVMVKALKKIRA
jgi:hypothetical protein